MFNLKTIFRPMIAIALVLTMLIGFSSSPAHAFGASSSKATDGEASLSEVRTKAEKVSNSDPRSGKEVRSVAQGGLNGVQGNASKDKMVKPEDTDATTLKDDIESGIKNLVGQ